MANFLTCKNGHNYDADQHTACPYCPAITDETNYKKTLTDFKNTQAFSDTQQFGKTMSEINGDFINGSADETKPGESRFKQTHIVSDEKSGITVPVQQSEKRKLVGWLVTFNNDQYGQDFKLYTGKNKIGTAPGCDIIINDSSVSGEHATLFISEKVLLIQDNFSTNGTKVNGNSIREIKLKEGL